ncbi:hypothetical protein [uncultured Nocardioides sp.]|uniref:hypothetical protein n=1 Tax=uncultured Nocardioides sp. TaxID=198441 RepID=UPI00262A12E7|nr:hypothetical protein [uncultured Nocardioides sp.]
MSDITTRLERELHADTPAPLHPARLADIRRDGRRRRTRRRALVTGGAGLAVALAVGTPFLVGSGSSEGPVPAGPTPQVASQGDQQDPEIQASPDLPPELAALQERILDEVPGAVRSSPTQVDLPDPRAGDTDLPPTNGYRDLAGPVVGLGVPFYATPDGFVPGAFPDWLATDWLEFADRARAEDDPRLTELADGALRVDAGEWRLGCESGTAAEGCRPVLLTRSGLTTTLTGRAGPDQTWLGDLGPDEVRVVEPDLTLAGDAPSLVVAGVARDDVTSVEFVSTTGETVEGRVDTELAPGTSILWAAVPGDVESVVVDGEML